MVFKKNKLVIFLAFVIGFILTIFLCSCNKAEGFAGWQGIVAKPVPVPVTVTKEEVDGLRLQVEERLSTLKEQLCPAFTTVRDEIAKDKGSSEKALAAMESEAGGKLYDCASYDDPLQIPANIGEIASASAAYLYKKLDGLMTTVRKALACEPIDLPKGEEGFYPYESSATSTSTEHYSDVVEYFADVCSPEQMKILEKKEKEEQEDAIASSCTAPNKIDYKVQKEILKGRLTSLDNAVKHPSWKPLIDSIGKILAEFREIKGKIDAGTLVPNCTNTA